MWKGIKKGLVILPFLAVKVLTAVQTGKDTYAVTNDWLKVLLIDGAFLALWLYLAYAPQGKQDRRNKVYASVVAALLYALMIGIGWEASPGLASIGVRFAGGAVLFWDIYAFTSQEWADWKVARRKRREERKQVEHIYHRQMSALMRWAIRISRWQLQAKVNNAVYNELDAMIPRYIRARSERAVNVVEGEVVGKGESSRSLTSPSQSIMEGWRTVADFLESGDTFKRSDVEQWTGYGKTYSYQIVNYGLQIGAAQEAPGKGMYVFVEVNDG